MVAIDTWEFVFVFPDRTVPEAAVALERLRQEILLALAGATVPGFTASFGVALLTGGDT